jgi:hypothetical protein
LAFYSYSHNFAANQSTGTLSGFTTSSYWMDTAIQNVAPRTGTFSGSAVSFNSIFSYSEQVSMVAGDQFTMAIDLTTTQTPANNYTFRDSYIEIYELSN